MTANDFRQKVSIVTVSTKDVVNRIFKVLLSPFFDADETFSWKKGMTGAVTFIFVYAAVGYLNKHNFDPLPASYQWIMAAVFAAYFGKDIPESLLNVIGKYFESKGFKKENLPNENEGK
ncbi:MAG: hypothetical protein WBK67_02940 [Minisyncoccales bacterium]